MKKKPYKRNPGDYEIRILPDGRMVMIAPDEDLIEIARGLESANEALQQHTKEEPNVGTTDKQTGKTGTDQTA